MVYLHGRDQFARYNDPFIHLFLNSRVTARMEEQICSPLSLSLSGKNGNEREKGRAGEARYRGGKTAEVRETSEKKDERDVFTRGCDTGTGGWRGWLRIIGTESAYRTRCARAVAPTRVTARGKVCCNVTFLAAVPFLV